VFEVVEKPDDWTRSLSRQAENAQSAAATERVKFWQLYLDRHPEAARQGISATGSSNKLLEVLPGRLFLGRYVASESSGVYLRGPRGEDVEEVGRLLAPHRHAIETRLGTDFNDGDSWYAVSKTPHPLGDPDGWPAAVDFLHQQTQRYLALLEELFPETER
jgi:hypothetical protein